VIVLLKKIVFCSLYFNCYCGSATGLFALNVECIYYLMVRIPTSKLDLQSYLVFISIWWPEGIQWSLCNSVLV
jgi:hypothetical protein